jgi:hypothetical protein
LCSSVKRQKSKEEAAVALMASQESKESQLGFPLASQVLKWDKLT